MKNVGTIVLLVAATVSNTAALPADVVGRVPVVGNDAAVVPRYVINPGEPTRHTFVPVVARNVTLSGNGTVDGNVTETQDSIWSSLLGFVPTVISGLFSLGSSSKNKQN